MQSQDIILEIKNIQEALEDVQSEMSTLSGEKAASADTAVILALTALDHAIAELEDIGSTASGA